MSDNASVVPLMPEADFEYDLAAVDIRCRASTLQSWNAQLFRNASIKGLPEEISHGYIQSYAFGAARLFRIGAAHAVIMHRAGGARAPVTLLLQLNGQSTARQSQRECHLKGADFTFVDSSVPFEFEASGDHELILVQMPRSVVFSRHPNIRDIMVEHFNAAGSATGMIWNFVTGMAGAVGQLDSTARATILLSLVELIGTATLNTATGKSRGTGHVRRALDFIESMFCQPKLNAICVANELGISRRRLDELFIESVGRSVSAHIWERRLVRAAIELNFPSKANSVTSIALNMGFEDGAHFSRAFKKRFKRSPTEWRLEAGKRSEYSLCDT